MYVELFEELRVTPFHKVVFSVVLFGFFAALLFSGIEHYTKPGSKMRKIAYVLNCTAMAGVITGMITAAMLAWWKMVNW
ncbi:MAG: hypothetical protein Q8L24_00540 [bacterium]|nr:hypothetical protein [bacterium]